MWALEDLYPPAEKSQNKGMESTQVSFAFSFKLDKEYVCYNNELTQAISSVKQKIVYVK